MLNSTHKITAITAILASTLSTQLHAQSSGEWKLAFDLKTNHLWHGFIVTDGVMTAGSLEYKSEDKKRLTAFGAVVLLMASLKSLHTTPLTSLQTTFLLKS
ncbi:hypothetical protein [Psychrosphaera algicola]|uniref:Uncharacterized protein n=1 Tax=Psychrosphaera algicola TaxID=3023714 RepID=A0ABT5F956_9GAMM|nr:hypothetical protein [Psychrosphaera sp. G1-22]MDC2888060.1 hypothetical protein [Psychrosphaera sp. G1-22]